LAQISGAGALATDKPGRYVTSVNISNGTIIVTFGKDANTAITGANSTLSFQPFVNANRDVLWQCSKADPPNGGVAGGAIPGAIGTAEGAANSDEPVVLNEVLDKYLPTSCRTGFGGAA